MLEDEPGGAGDVLRFLERQRGGMLETLRNLVELESPSQDKAAVDRLGEFVAAEFKRVGGQIIVHPDPRANPCAIQPNQELGARDLRTTGPPALLRTG